MIKMEAFGCEIRLTFDQQRHYFLDDLLDAFLQVRVFGNEQHGPWDE